MGRGVTRRVLITRHDDAGRRTTPDELVVEEPMEVLLDGQRAATTMRTPGNDFELAVGFCHGDGLLAGQPVTGVRYCATGSAVDTAFNVVSVDTGGLAPVPTGRLGTTTSSCGWCGSDSIDELRARLAPLPPVAVWPMGVLLGGPEQLREAQGLFSRTGAVHAAGALDRDGRMSVVREDVGRHNAVDKVVGRLLLDGRLPATDLALVVSGRASFEIVQKAWAAGFSAVVAVSAPSALAVETARAAGLTLVGFARPGGANVYSPAP